MNGKECKDHSVLLKRTGKNAKNVPFFYKERARVQERCVLLKRTVAQPCIKMPGQKIGKVFQKDVFIKMPRQKIRKVFLKDIFIKMPRHKIGKEFQKDVFIKMSRQEIGKVFQKDVFKKMS